MNKFLKNLDQFGVAFQPSIKYSTSQYKTCLGGVMSILLYGLSLVYLIYIFVQWQTRQLLPKITTSSDVNDNYVFQQKEQFIEIGLRKYGYTQFDPFDPEALVLQPLMYEFKNGMPITPYIPNYETVKQSNGFYHLIISNLSLSISELKNEEFPEIELMLTFGQCLPKFLKDGQKCANQTTVNSVFAQATNTIVVKQFAEEFNTQTEQLETIGREFILPFLSTKVFQSQTYIQISNCAVDKGFLFESIDSYEYINEFRVNSATLDLEYYNVLFQYNVYLSFFYKLDNIQNELNISYPKLSEILADAGSIASTLLLLSYLVVILNQSQLQFEAINHVIGMYYPEFKQVKITKNILGMITKAEKNGKAIEIKQFKQQYEKWSQISEIKLSISNQIYEISRLQFLMQTLQPTRIMQQIHQVGIPFPFQPLDSEDAQNKLDISVGQDFQYKQNSIVILSNINKLPNNENNNDANSKTAETKLVAQVAQVQTEHQLSLKDSDFDLLIIPEDEPQK